MNRKKNGFINLLFDENQSSLPFNFTKDHDYRLQQLHSLKKMTEEYMFSPKNRLRYIKIVKINDFVTVDSDKKSGSTYRDKIYVDGCRLTKILPIRQLVTQNQPRNKQMQRSYSPQTHSNRQKNSEQYMNKSLLCEREDSYLQSLDLQNPQIENLKVEQPQPLNLLLKNVQNQIQMYDLTVQNSTASSYSNRDFKPKSIRYRKISNFQKRQTISINKNLIETKKQIYKHYTNPPLNPQNISAKAYIVFQHFKQSKNKKIQKYLQTAFNSKINLQVASLTKIMTCLLTLEICEANKIDIKSQEIKIGHFETNIQGTKAQIQSGEIYTVEQLLYGLMLPSGNDASIALSVFCGEILENNKNQQKKLEVTRDIKLKKYYYKKFILQMNKKCIELEMKRTFFSNSHGLANSLNRSCASDMAILIDYALRNQLYRDIVGTKIYECSVFSDKNQSFEKSQKEKKVVPKQRKIKWQNTHKFIHTKAQFYKGIKTGTTEVAGPCLASLIAVNNREFIIIVLNSKSLKTRYKDTQALREWLFKKQQLSNDFYNQ